MIPEPQIPLASLIGASGRQHSCPMTLKETSSVTGLIRIRSIAPGAALIPKRMWAPSRAGPVAQEADRSLSRFPTTISPFVPTSMISTISPLR